MFPMRDSEQIMLADRWRIAARCQCRSSQAPPTLSELRFVSFELSSVVHCWPVFLTYWRSSWQIGQASGGVIALGVLRSTGRANEVSA